MMYFKMLKYDLKNLISKSFVKFIICTLIMLLFFTDAYMTITSRFGGTEVISSVSIMFYIFSAIGEYIPGDTGVFLFPGLWLFAITIILYIVLYYTYKDLLGYGKQVMVAVVIGISMRVVYVNKVYKVEVPEYTYEMNERVDYSSHGIIHEYSDGYSVEVLSAEVTTFENYLKKFDHTVEDFNEYMQSGYNQDFLSTYTNPVDFIVVKAKFINNGVDDKAIELIDVSVKNAHRILNVDLESIWFVYPEIGEKQGFSLKPNSEYILEVPVCPTNFERRYGWKYTDYLKEQWYFSVTTQGVIQKVRLDLENKIG